MKEIILKSKEFEGMFIQMLNGEFALYQYICDGEEKESYDNENYAYAMYRLLQAVDNRGGFDKLKTEDSEDKEEIYI